jgi:hydroxyacylglutathione hydrolase
LAELDKNMDQISPDKNVIIHCRSGYRSVVAASMMKAKGFKHVVNVSGGWNEIKNSGVTVETGSPANLVS